MKKIYAVIIALVILSVSIMGTVSATVYSQNDKVEITEKVLYGDVSAAEGITVINRNQYNHNLFWETEYKIGKKPKISTDYSFSATQKFENRILDCRGISMSDSIEYGFDEAKPYSEQTGLGKAYKALFDSSKEGETLKKTIYIKDYYDYYPIEFNFDLPHTNWIYNGDDTDWENKPYSAKYVSEKFKEYFKIPVLDTDRIEIEVSKSERGNSYGTGSSAISSYNIYSVSTYTDNRCFFAIRHIAYDKTGKYYVDTSQIPGGYGIYAFNYSESLNEHHTGIDAESLSTVYSLSQDISVEYMGVSPDNKRLWFFSSESNSTYFTVLDIETMTELQKICVDKSGFGEAYQYDDFLVARLESKLAVLTFDGNFYNTEFVVPSAESYKDTFQSFWGKDSIDFNGEKLTVVGSLIDKELGYETCNFYVSVYDKSGLIYYGEYTNQLSANYLSSSYGLNCQPYDYEANTVMWD